MTVWSLRLGVSFLCVCAMGCCFTSGFPHGLPGPAQTETLAVAPERDFVTVRSWTVIVAVAVIETAEWTTGHSLSGCCHPPPKKPDDYLRRSRGKMISCDSKTGF